MSDIKKTTRKTTRKTVKKSIQENLEIKKETKTNNFTLQKAYTDKMGYTITLYKQGNKHFINTSENETMIPIDEILVKELIDKGDKYQNLHGFYDKRYNKSREFVQKLQTD